MLQCYSAAVKHAEALALHLDYSSTSSQCLPRLGTLAAMKRWARDLAACTLAIHARKLYLPKLAARHASPMYPRPQSLRLFLGLYPPRPVLHCAVRKQQLARQPLRYPSRPPSLLQLALQALRLCPGPLIPMPCPVATQQQPLTAQKDAGETRIPFPKARPHPQ